MKEVARSAGRIAGQAAEAAESLTSETSDGTRSEGVAGFGQLAVPSREGQMLSLQDLGAGASLERSVLSPISSDQAASHGGTEIGRGHVERPIGGYIAKAPEEEGTPKARGSSTVACKFGSIPGLLGVLFIAFIFQEPLM